MTKASDNDYPSILLTEQGSAPSSPAASHQRLYIRTSDHTLVTVNSSGTVTAVGGGAADLAGYEYDYVGITSPVTISATSEATATTIVTGNAVAYNGSTVVLLEFSAPYVEVNNTVLKFVLYDGSSSIGLLGLTLIGTVFLPVRMSYRFTPSNATHTYSVRAYVNSSTATIGAGGGGTNTYFPAYQRITRVSS